MEKIWLKNYPPGVPSEINPDCYGSLNEVFEEACRVFSKKPAFSNFGTLLSYAELEAKADAFARFLQTDLKMQKGDRLALMMPNILQYPVALLGGLKAGLIIVNVNPLYTAPETEYLLKDSACQAIVVLANFAQTVQKALPSLPLKHIIVTKMGDLFPWPKAWLINFMVKTVKKMIPEWSIPNYIDFKKALKIGKTKTFVKPTIDNQDIAFLQYTGGTTGLIKGAMLTHRNMIANLEQASSWIKDLIKPGEEIIITALPLYHIFSLTANCLTFMKAGALNVLITNPRDIKNFVKELRNYRFTIMTGVNTLFNALLNNKEFAKLNFKYLKIVLGGGMSLQKKVAERWKIVTGMPLLEAYGLTEACPAVCINPLNLKEFTGNVGLPVPSTDISIRDEDHNELKIGMVGELWVKGPQVMRGYWQQPSETKHVLQEGWLATGDIVTMDENGYVKIVDRKKDIIVVSGFNVYPNEVEEVIANMKDVSEVAVIGITTEMGEGVKAFIVKKNKALTPEQVIEHCRQYLTSYKIPKAIEFRETLPKTHVGKILRRALRKEH